MTVTLNIQNKQLSNKILWLLEHFKDDGLEIITDTQKEVSTKEKPKGKFSKFAGMWKDRDITQKSIKEQAWR